MSLEVDIIFAGGGTAACVIAGRLIAVDPSLKILILESGQHSHNVPRHVQPCRYVENFFPNSTALSFYTSTPSAHSGGRRVAVACGRSVGGGSVVNVMLYVRGAASDYDAWAAIGNEGWSFNALLPFIQKLETFNPVPDRSATHGYSGPIQISSGGLSFDIGSQFLDVGRLYDPARPQADDNNDFVTANAYSPAYHYIDPVSGRRSDAASRYLYPHANNPNLTIMTGKLVKRVIIENGRAVAVEYTTDPKSSTLMANSELVIAKANKLIIVSGGAFGSPTILERSGVGSPSVLLRNNVHVESDLPGVGENYHDHVGSHPVFYAADECETMDDVWDNPEVLDAWLKQWEKSGTGKIAHSGVVALLKLRPTEAQLSSASSIFKWRWETFFERNHDKPMAIFMLFAGFPLSRSMAPHRKLLCPIYYLAYPESTGSVHITSVDELDSPLDFDPNFLAKDGDIAQLTLIYKLTRELIRRMPAYRGEVTTFHPKFPVDSPAACKEADVPVPIDSPNIVYSDADDEAIIKFHRDTVNNGDSRFDGTLDVFIQLGTCAMKPRNQGGVVDARLNVYGTESLKVADLSICPTNVGNNTYSTALAIGEKAAAIIAEDLGYEHMRDIAEERVELT